MIFSYNHTPICQGMSCNAFDTDIICGEIAALIWETASLYIPLLVDLGILQFFPC